MGEPSQNPIKPKKRQKETDYKKHNLRKNREAIQKLKPY